MTFTPQVRTLATFWGSIVSAASQRAGVAGAWQAVKDAGGTFATAEAKPGIQAMNTLYGLAVSNRNSMETLNAADPSAILTGEMIGRTLAQRTSVVAAAAPEYVIRLQLFGTDATGNETEQWLSITTVHTLPTTVGTLFTMLDVQVAAAGVGYGITTVNYSTVSIQAA